MPLATNSENLWLRPFQTGEHSQSGKRGHAVNRSTARLICFPHAGGAASYFHPLSQALAPGIEVLAVQYPGRQDRRREPRLTSIARLADAATEAMADALDGAPYAFFGHSMGAVLCYEVALRLRERGTAGPVRLFASGRRGPATYRNEAVHLRDDAGLIAELRRLGGTSQHLLPDEELLELAVPQARSDYRAVETYRGAADAQVDCPITVLSGDSDPQTTPGELAEWAAHSTAGCEFQVFPGGHFFLDSARPRVAEAIRAALEPEAVAAAPEATIRA